MALIALHRCGKSVLEPDKCQGHDFSRAEGASIEPALALEKQNQIASIFVFLPLLQQRPVRLLFFLLQHHR